MQEIKVYPNPFVALGPDGMPCGRVLVEPGHPRPYDVIGGKIERVRLEHEDEPHGVSRARTPQDKDTARRLDLRDTRIHGVAHVRMRPIAQRLSQWHRERVQSGDLVAADAASAQACGIKPKDFRPALDLLGEEMAKRVNEWVAINGEFPALASYALVQNGDEIALAAKDKAASGPARKPIQAAPKLPPTT